MKTSSVKFRFRVWFHPHGDCPELEVWYDGLESTEEGTRLFEVWAHESFYEYLQMDGALEFGIDPDVGHWQIVGEAEIDGYWDSFSEYDEIVSVIRFEKEEVRESFFSHGNELSDGDEV